MSDAKTHAADQRDELRAKIEARERRIAERSLADEARDLASAAADYTKANPLTVVGGAIALGLAIGLMTKPGRRAAANAASSTANAVSGAASGAAETVSTAAKKRGSAIATLFADAIVAYGIKLIDDAMDRARARAGQDTVEDISDAVAAKARTAKRDAEYAAGTVADKTCTMSQRTRRRAARAVRDLKDRVTN